jgi:excisionase family DNA binding protein
MGGRTSAPEGLLQLLLQSPRAAPAPKSQLDSDRLASVDRAVGTERSLLTVRETAQLLRVSTATVYRMCAIGTVPSVRVLNSIRIWAEYIGLG